MRIKVLLALMAALVTMLLSACGRAADARVDGLNEVAYAWHYRNLDSTKAYARQAFSLSANYADGQAEALNNLAFVSLAKMQYAEARRLLEQVQSKTDNQIELLVADVQLMRLCQRQSRNKEFYDFHERAERRLLRLREEKTDLSAHERRRLTYASTEFLMVASTYYYYVGLFDQAAKAIEDIDANGPIQQDTAQMLCYWYSIGSGGIVRGKNETQTAQEEFDNLMQCYLVAHESGYPYWEAQALQALSEHLRAAAQRHRLVADNAMAVQYVNTESMPDSLLAGNLAQRSLNIFSQYGDVYQTAGANRTLAECFWQIADYPSALICLTRALNDKAISQAPDLVASIREQLCLVYSAVDDKVNSDRNRNIYLDLQEQTRQDRLLEARADQLQRSSRQLNIMLVAVILMVVIVIILIVVFDHMRRRSDARFSLDTLLEPLRQWQKRNEQHSREVEETYEELCEQMEAERLHLQHNKHRNLEQRAKIQLVNSVTPFIDRMANEVSRLQQQTDSSDVRQQRYEYISELTDTINDHNTVLTQWIQMQRGDIRLHIESFALQPLFDIVARSKMGFQLKGITLSVEPTTAVVKADRVLTLFMVNTIADNARKFTPAGGHVAVAAAEKSDYVEVSISDTGQGMTAEQQAHIFDRTYTGGHGFGLKNCYGIIEKYRKTSRLFQVCTIDVESRPGEGSRFIFRLPKGVARLILAAAVMLAGGIGATTRVVAAPATPSATMQATPDATTHADTAVIAHDNAVRYADSAYFANINGQYAKTLQFADSCRRYLSPRDTAVILDISNETAVAALALHRWDEYHHNNEVYTRLFREASADSSLPEYVRTMQRSGTNKVVAIILLVLLLIIIFPAYYLLYYRHRLNYRICIDHIGGMNRLLLDEHVDDAQKLHGIEVMDNLSRFNLTDAQRLHLTEVVTQIRHALRVSVERTSQQQSAIEMAGDELRRLKMEAGRLHVSNNVLDNCLSTLKHETMYYPSRIRQLVDGSDDHLMAIAELVDYYRSLYAVLSQQALRQIGPARLEADQATHLQALLKRLNHGEPPVVSIVRRPAHYADITVTMTRLALTDKQCHDLFTPYTVHLDFLLCRQIVREMGEATNLRACGINAILAGDGKPVLHVVVPAASAAWFNETKETEYEGV